MFSLHASADFNVSFNEQSPELIAKVDTTTRSLLKEQTQNLQRKSRPRPPSLMMSTRQEDVDSAGNDQGVNMAPAEDGPMYTRYVSFVPCTVS
ncbi:hypothetical protein K435DRAFT_280614 [Dendrothele bispora CBS 962.96]|uniref:Uncharacterized protein n=1 Tax=Dendrothele bispora (strain CBS 962.96) TaxID=1314807 RepID=A0A4S8ML68_DENBC|nr:hypothetical protein K435DRAFT_280614 [Dendrothele bispora CBS 962.96]